MSAYAVSHLHASASAWEYAHWLILSAAIGFTVYCAAMLAAWLWDYFSHDYRARPPRRNLPQWLSRLFP